MQKLIFSLCIIILSGCGAHKSENFGFTQTGDLNNGLKDTTDVGQLKTAMDENKFEMFQKLISEGADVNARVPNSKNATLLIYSAIKDLPQFAFFLLNNKADSALADDDKKTATDHARQNERWRILLLLDSEEQQLQAMDLLKMIEAKRNNKVSELLQRGVNPNFIDPVTGETPLTKAILEIGNKVGSNPAAQAKSVVKSIEVAKTIISWTDAQLGISGTDINLPNQSGFTPLGYGISKNNEDNKEILALLKSLNAKETL